MELRHKSSAAITDQENWGISTWAHRAWLAGGCGTVIFSTAKSLLLIAHAPTISRPWLLLQSIFAAVGAYLVADLGTGIYHWAIDNYGSEQTPIFGSQIVGFERHHQHPWAITHTQPANNLHVLAAGVAVAALPTNLFCSNPVILLFVGVFGSCIIFCQQFHAWSHTPRGNLPPLVALLQDAGIILGRAEHAAHHRRPYNSNYCIVSGVWNRVLDKFNFFVALEVAVLTALGHKPRSWTDPNSESTVFE